MDKAERVAALALDAVCNDLHGRKGFGNFWNGIEEDIRAEIAVEALRTVAAILRHEFDAARREAMEEAENACLEEAEAQRQRASFGLEDDPQSAALNCAAAIRAAKEETCPPGE